MKNNFIRVSIFTSIFISILVAMSIIFTPKWYYQQDGIEPATYIMDGFYDEPKNSIDVLVLGSSNAYTAIIPNVIYNEYGITSYVLGSSVQRMWISYYYLEEALKYQKPKVVALEVFCAKFPTLNNEDRNRKALDYMKISKT